MDKDNKYYKNRKKKMKRFCKLFTHYLVSFTGSFLGSSIFYYMSMNKK